MNTVEKILKAHAEVYDPHRQLIKSLERNRRLAVVLIVVFLEVLLAGFFLYQEREIYAFVTLVVFFVTVWSSSVWHFKHVENLYGSLENFNIEEMRRFCHLVRQKSNVALFNESENKLVEVLVKDKLDKVHRLEQAKKNVYVGLMTVTLPFFISLLVTNLDNILFMTLTVMGIGLIMLFFSFKSAFKEYTSISKLEHTNQILKEIRLYQLIENRTSVPPVNEQMSS